MCGTLICRASTTLKNSCCLRDTESSLPHCSPDASAAAALGLALSALATAAAIPTLEDLTGRLGPRSLTLLSCAPLSARLGAGAFLLARLDNPTACCRAVRAPVGSVWRLEGVTASPNGACTFNGRSRAAMSAWIRRDTSSAVRCRSAHTAEFFSGRCLL